ncbi:MAG: hypothetical protein AAF376_13045 [Pseudomonadota bacterium]
MSQQSLSPRAVLIPEGPLRWSASWPFLMLFLLCSFAAGLIFALPLFGFPPVNGVLAGVLAAYGALKLGTAWLFRSAHRARVEAFVGAASMLAACGLLLAYAASSDGALVVLAVYLIVVAIARIVWAGIFRLEDGSRWLFLAGVAALGLAALLITHSEDHGPLLAIMIIGSELAFASLCYLATWGQSNVLLLQKTPTSKSTG